MSDFSLTDTAIDPGDLRESLIDPTSGGFASFEGWVRDHNEGRQVRRLEYQAYPTLAIKEGERIVAEAMARFPITAAHCQHRTGELEIGELAVWIGVAAAHRDEAFQACRYIIDEIKGRVPIWKKEHYVDGDSGWVECERCAHDHPREDPTPDYSRQTILSDVGAEGQAKLASSRVLVIGAGGLGSPVLAYLAGAGVGTLGIVDPDRLDASNLHRQVLYDLDRIGELKVELARERIKHLNPSIDVIPYEQRLSANDVEDVFREYDLVMDCTDSFQAKFLISDAAVLTQTPAIFASVYQYEGQLHVYDPRATSPCLRCLWDGPEQAAAPTCAESGVLGPVPGVFGCLQAMEALKILLDLPGRLTNEMLIFDLLHLTSRKIRSRRRTDCLDAGRCTMLHDLKDMHPEPASDLELEIDSLAEAAEAGYRLIDIRTPLEIEEQPLTGVESLQLQMHQLNEQPSLLDQAPRALLICSKGIRSHSTAQLLRRAGRDDVWSLAGGLARISHQSPAANHETSRDSH